MRTLLTSADRAQKNIDIVRLTDAQMERINNIPNDPARRGFFNSIVYNESDKTVLGWTLERLGWPYKFHDK